MVELFEPAQNLMLPGREPFGRERPSHPAPPHPSCTWSSQPREFDRAFRADVAAIEMQRPVAGRDGIDDRPFRKMALTKYQINKPHDLTSCFRWRTTVLP